MTTALLNIFGHAHHAHACPLDRPLLTNTGSRLHPEHGLLGLRQVPISLLIGTVHCDNGLWHRDCGFAGRAFTWLGLDIRLRDCGVFPLDRTYRDCGVFQLDHTYRDCGFEEALERGLTSSSKKLQRQLIVLVTRRFAFLANAADLLNCLMFSFTSRPGLRLTQASPATLIRQRVVFDTLPSLTANFAIPKTIPPSGSKRARFTKSMNKQANTER